MLHETVGSFDELNVKGPAKKTQCKGLPNEQFLHHKQWAGSFYDLISRRR